MYIFGGRGDQLAPMQTDREIYCHNVHYLDTTTRVWVTPVVYGEKPLGRRSHSACKWKLLTTCYSKINVLFIYLININYSCTQWLLIHIWWL